MGNASTLAPKWEYRTGGFIATSAVVVQGKVLVGSWDGYEYALNSSSGQLLWRTYLNQTSTANCLTVRGVSSTPTVESGTVYLGGGGSDWYALNLTTGGVLWHIFIGNTSTTGGHYNWASPLLYGSSAYVGVSSDCDTPLVQGQLLEVDLGTHQITHVFNTSTRTVHGASVWGSPTIDPTTNLVYIATGNGGQYGSSLVALNATTLAFNGSWKVPVNQSVDDGDFGGTPTVFADAAGRHLVGVANKNGIFYAFDATNVTAGPVWERRVAVAGDCPECGQGSISPATTDGTTLYVAGGATNLGDLNFSGSVRALDPGTGAVLWSHGSPGAILGGLASAGGMVVDSAGAHLEVLNASTGTRLLDFVADSTLYTAPSVAEGLVFVSSSAGTLYALGPTSGHWIHLFTPPSLANASMAYDAHDGYTVLFGGCGTDGCPSAETWRWLSGTWTNVTPIPRNASNSPSPRSDPALAYDPADGVLLLFGGYAPGQGDFGDTWTYHAGTWTRISPSSSPPARSGAAMAYDAAIGKLVLFGGMQHGPASTLDLGDTWEYSASKWTSIKTGAGHAPSARDAAGIAYVPGDKTVLVFGGRASGHLQNDTWELSGKKWNLLHPSTAPPAMYGASLAYENTSAALLLFGGHGSGESVLSATWRYASGTWALVATASSPSARFGSPLTYDALDGYSMLYGGTDTLGQPLSDLWKFNGTQWIHAFPTSPGGARYGAGSAYDAADGYLVIFGGHNPTSTFYSNTMKFTGTGYSTLCSGCTAGHTAPSARDYPAMGYDPSTGTVVLFGGLGANGPLADTWAFSAGKWSNLTPNVGSEPSARYGASFAYDPDTAKMVLFGGHGAAGVLNDSWVYDAGTWSPLAVVTAPPGREGASLAYDPGLGRLVLFGGGTGSSTLADTWTYANGTWALLGTVTSPPSRSYAGLAEANVSGALILVLVGGFNGSTYLSDSWTFTNGSWAPLLRSLSPGARAGAVVAYVPTLGELVVYGGKTASTGLLSAGGDTWWYGVSA